MEYKFTINDFEGPLDLLLHLVRTSKMDIYTINIKDLIDEYLEFINSMDKLNIDVTSEYLVMAAELIHLKSRMLINKNDEEESTDEYEINTEDELRKRLKEYEDIKNVKDIFKGLEEKRLDIYEKLPENISNYIEDEKIEGMGNVDDLYQAIIEFQKKLKLQKPLNTKITKKEISIDDRKKDIRKILDRKGKVEFLELFDVLTKEYIVVTFISILDMSKTGEIIIEQEDNFKPIIVEKR